jgi:hypothetical protein
MHGGFENETPNIPTNTIMKLELPALLASVPTLLQKLEQSIGPRDKRPRTNPGGTVAGNLGGENATDVSKRS